MHYPGRVIKAGEQDAAIMKALKTQLNDALVDPSLWLELFA